MAVGILPTSIKAEILISSLLAKSNFGFSEDLIKAGRRNRVLNILTRIPFNIIYYFGYIQLSKFNRSLNDELKR